MKTKNTNNRSLNLKQPDTRITVRLPEDLFLYVKSLSEPITEVVIDALNEKKASSARLDLAYIEGFIENSQEDLRSQMRELLAMYKDLYIEIKEVKEYQRLIAENIQYQ